MWNGSSSYGYGYGYARRYISKQFSYFEQPNPNSFPPYNIPFIPQNSYPLPLDLAIVKQYLKIEPGVTVDDNLILILMDVVTEYAESYTKRDFITKNYLTYRDDFSDGFFVLRKSKLQQVISFKYFVNTVLIDVPSVWYATNDEDFSSLNLLNRQSWPNNIDSRLQAIQILFSAGYGPDSSFVPDRIKLALMQHILQMYENRGDCTPDEGTPLATERYLPLQTRTIYEEFRITDINTTPYN